MTHPFECPKCGHRNYLTRKDMDANSAAAEEALMGKRMKGLTPDELDRTWSRQGAWANLVLLVFVFGLFAWWVKACVPGA